MNVNGFENAELKTKRTVKIIIDIEVEIRDVPRALIEKREISTNSFNPEFHDRNFLELQSRIIDALIKSPDYLNRVIVEFAGSTAADELSKKWQYSDGAVMDFEELIAALHDELLVKDIKYLEKTRKEGFLSENTEIALFDSFETKVLNISEKIGV